MVARTRIIGRIFLASEKTGLFWFDDVDAGISTTGAIIAISIKCVEVAMGFSCCLLSDSVHYRLPALEEHSVA